MNGKLLLAALASLTLMAETSAPAAPGRYLDLLAAKSALEQESRVLSEEEVFIATGEACILLDVTEGVLHFRIGGVTLKTSILDSVASSWPHPRSGDVLRVTRVGSGGPRLLPPAPATGRAHALLFEDPDIDSADAATQQQGTPVSAGSDLPGVEAPTHYTVQTDSGRFLHIRTDTTTADNGITLTTDPATARGLYRSLSPGTPIIVVQSFGLRNR